jgi:uncharacterized protein
VVRSALLLLIKGYRYLLSPWMAASCRFEPSCSAYAYQAIERHGAIAGTGLAGWRLLRCHPWCDGGCDPVPDRLPPLMSKRGFATLLIPPRGAAGRAGLGGLFTRWLGVQCPLPAEPDIPGPMPPGSAGTDTRKTFE